MPSVTKRVLRGVEGRHCVGNPWIDESLLTPISRASASWPRCVANSRRIQGSSARRDKKDGSEVGADWEFYRQGKATDTSSVN
ncbi:hypothetical protein SAMN05216486_1069 [bacterium JGI 053]|nr:hypothetical protein SAMN05216486_1069 [bacterium JGI 053]